MSVYGLHTFRLHVTPPVGDYICAGLQDPALGVESPLELRGIVLTARDDRYVIAAVDFCYLIGRSHHRLEQALADGAGVARSQVTVHSVHVHDAPLINEESHRLVEERVPGLRLHNEVYFAGMLDRVRQAVADAVKQPCTPIGGVAFASHPPHEFASSRRVLDDKGQIHVRWSVTDDAWIRSQPVGVIDPLLDLVTFYDDAGQAAACLSFYATHPQVSNGRRLFSSDTVGVARDLFEQTHPGVTIVHCDGCGGDVTAGKYTTTNRPRNRLAFGLRLFDAMEEAFAKSRPRPLGRVQWIDRVFEVPLRRIPDGPEHYDAIIRDPATLTRDRYLAGNKLVRLLEGRNRYTYRVSRLCLDENNLLFLPAEMCVPYQLYAKARCRGPLAVAAYGDCFLNYVPTDEAFDQGGYEIRPQWAEVDRGIEPIVKRCIDAVLDAGDGAGDGGAGGRCVAATGA